MSNLNYESSKMTMFCKKYAEIPKEELIVDHLYTLQKLLVTKKLTDKQKRALKALLIEHYKMG